MVEIVAEQYAFIDDGLYPVNFELQDNMLLPVVVPVREDIPATVARINHFYQSTLLVTTSSVKPWDKVRVRSPFDTSFFPANLGEIGFVEPYSDTMEELVLSCAGATLMLISNMAEKNFFHSPNLLIFYAEPYHVERHIRPYTTTQ